MIPIRSAAEIDHIRAACIIVHSVQMALETAVAPGVSTQQLDELAEATIRDQGGTPAFKGYHDFPASICTSVNAEAVHGFPRTEPLRDGDVVCVDVGVKLDGWFGDGAFTIGVGHLTDEVHQLLTTTRAALEAGIAAAVAGGRLTDISHAVEMAAVAGGATVIREYGGHGIGRDLHEDPQLRHRGHFAMVEHPRLGSHPCTTPAFHISDMPPDIRPAPSLGQDTEVVCREILGLSESEYAELADEGVFS